MGLFENLERLRQKPERERKRIAAVSALGIMAIIITIWINNLDFTADQTPKKSAPNPLSVIGATFGEGVKGIKKTFLREMASTTIYRQNQDKEQELQANLESGE